MKTFTAVLLVSASVLAGAVQAAEPEIYPPEVNTRSDVSRAQVIAELHAAQVAGLVAQGQEPNYPEAIVEHRTRHEVKTRAQVQAELTSAMNAGQLVEGQAPSYPANFVSGNSSNRS